MIGLALFTDAQTSSIIGKTWIYSKVIIIYQQDSLVVFDADSNRNHWYMARVSMRFNVDHTYNGKDINGNPQNGTWSMPTLQTIVVDTDTNQVISVAPHQFSTKGLMRYRDSVTDVTGTLYTVFSVVPQPIGSCVTIQSGDWTNPSIWSCGRAPTENDNVIIQNTHTVLLSSTMPEATCLNLEILGTFSMQGSSILINGNRIVVDQDNVLTK